MRHTPARTYVDGMRSRLDPVRLDIALSAVLLVLVAVQVIVVHQTPANRWATAVVGGLVGGSVAVRRRYPAVIGIGVQTLLAATGLRFSLPAGPITIGWFCALYALAVWTTFRLFVVGLIIFVTTDLAPEIYDPADVSAIAAFTFGAVAVMIMLRIIVSDRDRRLSLAARERDLAMREAVGRERARIARELHDVIAHYVSMMVVQAGAERRVLHGTSPTTYEVLATIEQLGRSALAEMRRLVGMLRGDEQDPLAPQHGLADVAALVAQARDAGLPVELSVHGEPRDIPVGVDVSAYRIVQEGLTNAIRHAGSARTAVRLRYAPESVAIEIVDDGAAADGSVPSGATAGSGMGLVGIRERVALYGGTLDAGRRAEGGFAVRVLLPTR
jgi:signal transduction histidine kinase